MIYLASLSPRRHELLDQIGVPHERIHVDVDEAPLPGENPEAYVIRLAVAKARAGWNSIGAAGHIPVLAADTAVVVDGAILGKPTDREDALRMLARLAGRTHRVMTGVALIEDRPGSGELVSSRLSISRVTFRPIAPDEALRYWESGEPADKAGGYGIQGLGALFVADLAGSYSGVMGLPLFETGELLREGGVATGIGRP